MPRSRYLSRTLVLFLMAGLAGLAPAAAAPVSNPAAPAVSMPLRVPAEVLAASLPAPINGVAPGPDILHRPPADAPQLENTGIWKADPTMVCMASVYRAGEFLYQDCIWDDNGGGPAFRWPYYTFMKAYRYPTAETYRNNAADIVEVRMKPLDDATAIRITYNTMTEPGLVGTTIALGDSPKPVDAPHGANTRMPAQLFVTVHGDDGDIVDAATGTAVPVRPTVTTDLHRRQVEVRVPYAAFDPRGDTAVRVAAAAGLWDEDDDRYHVPREGDPTETEPGGARRPNPSAFFNVAFRYDEPMEAAWRDHQQLAAIERGDISEFFATVDFTKLAAGVDDDMVDARGGIPSTGYMNLLFASHFESRQGRRLPNDPNGPRQGQQTQQNGMSQGSPGSKQSPTFSFGWPCRAPEGGEANPKHCVPDLAGRLQRYVTYIPKVPAPAEGYGILIWTNGYALAANEQVQGEGDLFHEVGDRPENPTLVVATDARGADQWGYGQSGASNFENWVDVARRFKLDPTKTAMSGFSSGAYTANKLALQFPDVFGKAFICDGLDLAPSFPGANGVGDAPLPADTITEHEPGSRLSDLLPSRRNQPVMEWAGSTDDFIPYHIPRRRAQIYAAGDYDYEFITWNGPASEHLTMCHNGTWDTVLTPWLRDMNRAIDPTRVTYVRNPLMDDPGALLVGNRAYWLSAIETRAKDQLGTIDVTSAGFGLGPAPVPPAKTEAGSAPSEGETKSTGFDRPDVQHSSPSNPYIREYRHLGPQPPGQAADKLTIKATNIERLTVDPQRARVSCNAQLDVETDGLVSITLLGCGGPRDFNA